MNIMKEPITSPLPKPPKYIGVDYRTLPDIDNNPLFYNEDTQDILSYWTDGKKIYWRFSEISTDVEHFVWFNGRFAKDSKHCFLQNTKLRNVDHTSFIALNNCYAKDNRSVWTTGGRFEPEDNGSFVVCDDGVRLIENIQTMSDGTRRSVRMCIPYGYAKDSKAVYYENFSGKIKILKKADPATFVSNNDGYFAWDAKSIFWGGYPLPGADLQSWHIVDTQKALSRDTKHFYIQNKRVTEEEWEHNVSDIMERTNDNGIER